MIVSQVQSSKRSRLFASNPSAPITTERGHRQCALEVVVIFTDVPGTLKALKTAAELAQNLNGRIRVLAPQVVPYPLPLASPPVSKEFNQRAVSNARVPGFGAIVRIDTRVELCLCRDRVAALCQALEPEAVVVIGVRQSWWPTAEKAVARKVHSKGHHVILVNSERSK